MPYSLQLKCASYPPAKLRDGVGFSAPVRLLSELYPVAFDNLPAPAVGDPNIILREVSDTEAMVIRDDMLEAMDRAEQAYAAHRALAHAKIQRQAAQVQPSPKAGPVAPAVKHKAKSAERPAQ